MAPIIKEYKIITWLRDVGTVKRNMLTIAIVFGVVSIFYIFFYYPLSKNLLIMRDKNEKNQNQEKEYLLLQSKIEVLEKENRVLQEEYDIFKNKISSHSIEQIIHHINSFGITCNECKQQKSITKKEINKNYYQLYLEGKYELYDALLQFLEHQPHIKIKELLLCNDNSIIKCSLAIRIVNFKKL